MINLSVVTTTSIWTSEFARSLWHGKFFANNNPHALISVVAFYYHFNIGIHAEFPSRVAISTSEIIEGVVRDCDIIT